MTVRPQLQKWGADAQAFWGWFFAEVWGKRPYLIPRSVFPPLANERELFESLRAACDDYRLVRRDVSIQLYINSRLCMADHARLLPMSDDEAFSSYENRLQEAGPKDEVTLTIYGMQYYSTDIFQRCKSLLRQLYAQVGMPMGHVDADVFFGRYGITPTGIHKDSASNFSYVVKGSKEYWFWSDREIAVDLPGKRQNLGGGDVSRYEHSAVKIKASPGDAIYWPSSNWHVAVNQTEWTATLNLACYEQETPASLLASFIPRAALVEALEGAEAFITPSDGNVDIAALFQPLSKSYEVLRSAVNDELARNSAAQRLLKKASAAGFEIVPPMLPDTAVSPKATVVVKERPIVCLANDLALIAANGHIASVSRSSDLLRFLDTLQLGRIIFVEAVLAEFPNTSGFDVLALVRVLTRMRSLAIVSSL